VHELLLVAFGSTKSLFPTFARFLLFAADDADSLYRRLLNYPVAVSAPALARSARRLA
jgi:hypothetical protein